MERKRVPRRYDTALKCLRELAQSKSEKVRLAAVMRMTEIFLEFDRSQERVAIATARAEARKADRLEALAGLRADPDPTPEPRQTDDEVIKSLLADLQGRRADGDE